MRNRLVFLDIDGTLLDDNYQCNFPELTSLILKQASQGTVFGLNSNRSLQDLLPVAAMFGIQGPIVGENGLFAYMRDSQEVVYLLDKQSLQKLFELNHQCKSELRTLLAFRYNNVEWIDCDTVAFLSNRAPVSYKEGTVVVLNNKFRMHTTSAHIKRMKGGQLIPFEEELEEITRQLQQISDFANELIITYSPVFSNLLVYSNKVTKKTAVKELLVNKFKGYEVIAIGDESSDAQMVEGLGTFMTVGNANARVKLLATHETSYRYAHGVYELLSLIG